MAADKVEYRWDSSACDRGAGWSNVGAFDLAVMGFGGGNRFFDLTGRRSYHRWVSRKASGRMKPGEIEWRRYGQSCRISALGWLWLEWAHP